MELEKQTFEVVVVALFSILDHRLAHYHDSEQRVRVTSLQLLGPLAKKVKESVTARLQGR